MPTCASSPQFSATSFLFCDLVSLLWQNDTAWQQTPHKMRFSCSFSQNVFAFILYYYWPTAIKKGLIETLRELQILGQGVAPSHEQSRKRLFSSHFWRPWGDPWTDRSPQKLIIFSWGLFHIPIRTSSKSIQNFLSYLTHKQTGEKVRSLNWEQWTKQTAT